MNANNAEKLVLREQSGDLNFVRRGQLRRALAANPGLVKFRDDLLQITTLSRTSGPDRGLDPVIFGEIRKAAAEQDQIATSYVRAAWLRPAIATFAAAAMIAGIAVVNQVRPPVVQKIAAHFSRGHAKWDDDVDAQISSVSNMLAATFDAPGETVGDENSIAHELLNLEGAE